MRIFNKLAGILSLVFSILVGPAQAAFVGSPMGLGVQLQRIRFETPTLAPMAHTVFCIHYPTECRKTTMMFRSGRVKLTPERMQELVRVNADINTSIRPEPNLYGLAGEK